MNDLDLRTALHRDADLVGSPSPDLLDQLVRRRQLQRRQRAGMLTSALAVVVIAAGIPISTSLLARSDSGPATETTVDPTPTVSVEVTPTPTPVPTPEVNPSTAPETSVAAPSTSAVDEVNCPDIATLQNAMPADTANQLYRLSAADAPPVCSGTWAAAGYSDIRIVHAGDLVNGVLVEEDEEWRDGQAGIYRYVGGSWTWLDRYHSDVCDDAGMPAEVRERGCNVD
jgi:hypothetical protein